MGIIETKQIKGAIKRDGSQNVKKSAFIYGSCLFIETEKQIIKKCWEQEIEQYLDKNLKIMEQKKQYLQKLLDAKQNQLQSIDIEFIDKIQTNTGMSFNELSGYKKANKKLTIYQQLLKRIWREEIGLILVQIDDTIQKVKQTLLKQSPQLPAFDLLGDQIKQKAFQQYITDQAFEIQRQRYNSRAIRQFEKMMDFDRIIRERFAGDQVQQQVEIIVNQFQQKLNQLNTINVKCGGFCC